MISEPLVALRAGAIPKEDRIIGLDFVRGLAAFAVAIPHFISNEYPDAATAEPVAIVSVEVFFLLSGFVLAPQLLYVVSASSMSQRLSRLRIFLMRRWMRTIPPYLIALFAVSILSGNLFTDEFFKLIVFSQNMFSLPRNEFFVAAWSLSVEEWFYIVFPLFLLVARACSIRPVTASLIFLVLFFALKLIAIASVDDLDLSLRRLVVFRLDAICFGFLLFIFYSWIRQYHLNLVRWIGVGLLTASMIVLVLLLIKISNTNAVGYRLTFIYVAPLFASGMLLTSIASEPIFLRFPWLANLATRSGAISYDVYLFHTILLLLWSALFVGWGFWIRFSIYLVLLITISLLCFIQFEKPILAVRPRYGA